MSEETQQALALGGVLILISSIVFGIGLGVRQYRSHRPRHTYYVSKAAFAPVDENTETTLHDALNVDDRLGIEELINQEKLLGLQPGDRVLILGTSIGDLTFFLEHRPKTSLFKRRVRVIEGKYRGRAAIIYDRYLAEQQPAATTPMTAEEWLKKYGLE